MNKHSWVLIYYVPFIGSQIRNQFQGENQQIQGKIGDELLSNNNLMVV